MEQIKPDINRIERTQTKLDVLGLLDAVGHSFNYHIGNEQSNAQFLELIGQSLEDIKSPTVLYGQRTEAMFAYVAASLGKTKLVKQEDDGTIFCSDPSVKIPDYRVVLQDGAQFLVEVKNVHRYMGKGYSVPCDYMEHLLYYSQLLNTPLYFALYWPTWGLWMLIAPEDFIKEGNKYHIPLETMWKRNRMSMLGDALIATTPPLAIRFYTDKSKSRTVQQNGVVYFTIGAVELICNHRTITDDNEKKVAFSLMLFGGWSESTRAVFDAPDSQELDFIEFSYSPETHDEEPSIPPLVGAVSTIISRQYNSLTTENGEIHRLTPNVAPGFLGFILPESYKSNDLPLWIFHQQPNFE